jgi:eukaryotic-like serine/threonine-protein kinase
MHCDGGALFIRIKLPHIGLLLSVSLLVFSAGCGGSLPAQTASPPTASPAPIIPATDDWTTFAHDYARTGNAGPGIPITSTNVSGLQLRWNFQSPAAFQASPIAVNGILYAVDQSGIITALRERDGGIVWQRQLPIGGDVEMTPTYDAGLLFVGERGFQPDPTTSSGERAGPSDIWAINPTDGTIVWTAQVPGLSHGPPLVLNGTLYVGSSGGDAFIGCVPGGIYTFNEKTGTPGSSWVLVPGSAGGGSVWSPISTDGTKLYFGTGNTCSASPFDDAIASTTFGLTPLWTYSTDDNFGDDDDVGSGVSISGSTGYVMTKSGVFYAMNLIAGVPLWSFETNAPLSDGGFSTPTVVNGWAVFGGGYRPLAQTSQFGGWLFGVSPGGTQHWEIDTTTGQLTSPVGVNDFVIAELDSTVDAIDPTSGRMLWSSTTAAAFKASPAVTNNGVYVADLSGMIYAFGTPSQNAGVRTRLLAIKPSAAKPAPRPMCFTGVAGIY